MPAWRRRNVEMSDAKGKGKRPPPSSSQDRDQASEVSTLLVEKLKSKPRVKIRLWHTLLERANAPGSSLQQRNLALALLDIVEIVLRRLQGTPPINTHNSVGI